jgi:hypothetical protein
MRIIFSDSYLILKVVEITEQNTAEFCVRSFPEAHRGSLQQCWLERAACLTEANGTT